MKFCTLIHLLQAKMQSGVVLYNVPYLLIMYAIVNRRSVTFRRYFLQHFVD